MAGLEHTGLHIYTDNYYTSPLLFNHLYNRVINACGTARVNRRHSSKELETVCMQVNKIIYPVAPTMCVSEKMYDLFFVHFPYSRAPIVNPCTVSRLQIDGTHSEVTCPPCSLIIWKT